jgi:hypothetical protein
MRRPLPRRGGSAKGVPVPSYVVKKNWRILTADLYIGFLLADMFAMIRAVQSDSK